MNEASSELLIKLLFSLLVINCHIKIH